MSGAQNHISRQSDDEEEDLELLRLAALKSLHTKKETGATIAETTPSYQRLSPSKCLHAMTSSGLYPPLTQMSMTTSAYMKSGVNTIRVCDNGNVKLNPYYGPPQLPSYNLPLITNRPQINPIDNFNSRSILDKMDINEPYIPQRVPPLGNVMSSGTVHGSGAVNGLWMSKARVLNSNYTPYIPHKQDSIGICVSSIQLSPRSLAFVEENNDILMRRKGENISPTYTRSPLKSPIYRPLSSPYRSPSPTYRQTSIGRWSHSPPPQPKLKSKSRSPHSCRSRPHHGSNRRSVSRSPPPFRQRSPNFRRRSLSRSPGGPVNILRHSSPQNYHRHTSRTPPNSINSRRIKSRTPPQHSRHKSSPRRHPSRSPGLLPRHGRPMSRSPLQQQSSGFNGSNNNNGTRRRSPQVRYVNKNRRSQSPQQTRSKRSPGHLTHDLNSRQTTRGGRSPLSLFQSNSQRKTVSPPSRMRSVSRSPARKYQRRSRERGILGPNNGSQRRRSPYNTSNRRRFEGGSINGFRNRGRKRSGSPLNERRRKSNSRTPERIRRGVGADDNRGRGERQERDNKKFDENLLRNDKYDTKATKMGSNDKLTNKMNKGDDKLREKEIKSNGKKLDTTGTPPLPKSSTQQDQQETTLIQKTEEKNIVDNFGEFSNNHITNCQNETTEDDDDNDEDDDDGIDLFPSDESESENEGRFKSSTSKNERDTQASTLSFTKLSEPTSSSVIVKDLEEIGTTSTGSRSGGSLKNDRSSRSRNMHDRRRNEDRFRKTDSNRNSRNDRRKSNSYNNTNTSNSNANSSTGSRNGRSERDDTSNASNKKSDDKKKKDKPMFKSTFQAVESEVTKASLRSSNDKESSERKSLKRRLNNKEAKEETENTIDQALSSCVSSPMSTSSSSSNQGTGSGNGNANENESNSNNSGLNSKKPIHLRLGAMTNTFKTPKKASTWANATEKV